MFDFELLLMNWFTPDAGTKKPPNKQTKNFYLGTLTLFFELWDINSEIVSCKHKIQEKVKIARCKFRLQRKTVKIVNVNTKSRKKRELWKQKGLNWFKQASIHFLVSVTHKAHYDSLIEILVFHWPSDMSRCADCLICSVFCLRLAGS